MDLLRERVLMEADLLRQRAAWMKPASRRDIDRAWRFTGDLRPGEPSLVQARRSGEQGASIWGGERRRRAHPAVAIARAAGVTIALGSDFGRRDDHGGNLAEIGLLRGAGLTVEEALLAATWAGAGLCGVSDRLGRLAPGYEFDAVLLDDDPADMRTFTSRTSVTGVFKRGVAVVPYPRLEPRGAS